MRRYVRTSIVAVSLGAAFLGAGYRVAAGQEKHPVLRNSIRQLEGVRDRLQKAPTDFGGHKEAAIDAIGHAIHELEQAIQFDRR
jgi:hypothetical protein